MASVTFLGRQLRSPFVIGSGPMSYGARGLIRLSEGGAGAVVTKTLCPVGADNNDLHMVRAAKDTLINCEKWSDYPVSRWLDKELPESISAGVNVIASVGRALIESEGHELEEVAKSGVMALEVVSYDKADVIPMLREVRRRVDIPIISKLSPNWGDLTEIAADCEALGCDAFTACDSMGPALRIDIETGEPLLGDSDGRGWLTGASILPFTLQKVCQLRRQTMLPIIGLGGVTTWQAAVEMGMAGADMVGVCTVVIYDGPSVVGSMSGKMDEFLSRHGYGSFSDIRGMVMRHEPKPIAKPYRMTFAADLCTHCGTCERVCPYEARSFDDHGLALVDCSACRHCGLCVSDCPRHALAVA